MKPTDRGIPITLVMALSGGATLAGEVLGARLLRLVLGSTGIAQAGAVAGVLGGLGLGAWWTGRALARGRVTPRRVLVAAHVALAALVLLAPSVAVRLATPGARVLVAADDVSRTLGTLLRIVVGFAPMSFVGLLAGSVYPAAVARLGRGAGTGTAWTGAASSLGAAATALATTFVLAPAWGVASALRATAVPYLLAAWIAGASRDPPEPPPPEKPPPPRPGPSPLLPMVLVGAASTLWQHVVSRLGELSFGPSAYALAAALAAHVTALAAGELLAVRRVDRAADPPRALGRVAAAGSFAALFSLPLVLHLPQAGELRFRGGAPPLATLWASAYAVVTLATLPVIACVGAAMAFGARAFAEQGGLSRGDANGRTLLSTGTGNVLGAVLGPLVLVPLVRVEGAMLGVALLLGVAGASLLRPSRAHALAWAFASALLAVAGVARIDPEALSSGPYLYAGSSNVDLGRVVWRRDGREGTVVVRRDPTGNVLLQINGKVDATSAGDATTQTLVGIVPAAMARAPRDALVIGLGSGMTADAVRAVPGVEHVTVVEISPDVVRAARRDFGEANHHVLDSSHVHVIESDAAHWLRGTSRSFDVIVSEPSNPWVAGMSDLFTREAFEAARERLRPGGTMGAWFHAYGTDAETFASVIATFRSVFARCALVEIATGQDYLLVGVREPYALDVDAFLARVRSPAARERLDRAGVPDDAALVARFVAGTDGVRAIAADAPVLTAQDLVLEFRAPALLYRDAMADVFALLSRAQDLPFAGLSPHGTEYVHAVEASEPAREAVLHARNMVLLERTGALDRAIAEGDLAVASAPGDAVLRTAVARLYLRRATGRRMNRDPGGAEGDLTSVLELNPYAAERLRALVALGDLAASRRDGRRAAGRYDEALAIARHAGEPAPELHLRLANALAMLGDREDAARELATAIRETRDPERRRALERLRE